MFRSIFRANFCALRRQNFRPSFRALRCIRSKLISPGAVTLPEAVADSPKLGFFPGSTIGNMVARTAVDLLRSMRETLGTDAMLLIGMDLVKDADTLTAAYDDSAGVTAAFNMNLITRINRELGGTIRSESFAHLARWNDTFSRIEMHLEALEDTAFEVSGTSFYDAGW